MEAANADEIRTDERAASDVSVGFWVSNQEADVQGLLWIVEKSSDCQTSIACHCPAFLITTVHGSWRSHVVTFR